VASGRDLLREANPPLNSQVVLLADPSFDLAPRQTLVSLPPDRGGDIYDMTDLSFDPLFGTRTETNALSEKFKAWHWATYSLVGRQATKPALMRIHSPYILHLATHGFFAPEAPVSSTKRNRPEPLSSDHSLAKSKFFKNPMHRSGLALAGANSTIEAWKEGQAQPIEEDGILTAEDVSTLDLQGTWLVTLSACDTGSGEARAGEGVMGLRRGFVQAGAQNLLMTLWPISDEFTPQIMSDFYEAAHNSGNAPESLTEVQRNWLVKLRTEKGLAKAVNLAGPFIMSSQGKP
jgi:CHAT domain-containing protein